MVPYTATAEFTQAVDNLFEDPSVPDTALHSRAHQYLDVFNQRDSPQVQRGAAWAERIHSASPGHLPMFTSLGLFNAMYQMADELGMVGGKRYVSAAICVCVEHAIHHHAGEPQLAVGQAASVARALHDLSSTWVAFVLWPFYAFANRDTTYAWLEDVHAQVMARDDYRCFMTGVFDGRSPHRRRIPQDPRFLCCGIASIIPSEVWAHEDARSQDILFSTLERFCGVDRTTLINKATQEPQNTLFTYVAVADGFERFLWSLHPTEDMNGYTIKTYGSPADEGCRHTTTHVAFADHSTSANFSAPAAGPGTVGADLPDRELLRVHAALAGVLHHSGVRGAFVLLRYRAIYARLAHSVYPEPSGSAFWGSVVEYAGPEVCLEVERELGEDGSESDSTA